MRGLIWLCSHTTEKLVHFTTDALKGSISEEELEDEGDRSVEVVSYMVKGTGLRKERPSSTTNLLCDLNKSFTFTWVIRKMEIMRILMINQ